MNLRAFGLGLVALFALTVTPGGLARADTKQSVFASLKEFYVIGIGDYQGFDDLLYVHPESVHRGRSPSLDLEPLPLDTGIDPYPWAFKTRADDFGIWAYADDTGRVRTRVRTGTDPRRSSSGRLDLYWKARFRRDSAQAPSFTLNPSWLEVVAPRLHVGPQLLFNAAVGGWDLNRFLTKDDVEDLFPELLARPLPPFARMRMKVDVWNHSNAPSGVWSDTAEVFMHRSGVSGIAYDKDHPTKLNYATTDGSYDLNYEWRNDLNPHPVEVSQQADFITSNYCIDLFQIGSVSDQCQQELIEGYHFEIGPYTGSIDLDAIGVRPGDEYSVSYSLTVEAGEDQAEQFAEAFLADPLDNDAGGFSLETSDSLVPASTQLCRQAPDPARYERHGDGTVTDLATGLMWQRCPVGTVLDDLGTGDPDDDVCRATNPVSGVDWQSALQAAEADTTAGYSDWRLPSVKALESLVLPGCTVSAADRLAFPDTPPTEFWSSTPLREDPVAWKVDFFDGDVRWARTDETAYVRLVRDSSSTPRLLRPEITIEGARVAELGESETAVLSFPVRLSRPHDEDVSVAWETAAGTATAGTDFAAASGELSIQAGEVVVYIDIAVSGDRKPEGNEVLHVNLSDASVNAHLAVASARGVIEDDEPTIRASVAEAEEGDSGATVMPILLHLDRPAATLVTLNYATEDGSARAGDDYVATAGIVQINAGEQEAEIRVTVNGDVLAENDEQFDIEFSNPDGLHLSMERVAATIVDDDGPGTYAALNDTGITHCASGDDGFLPCPQSGLPLQDGDVGRDVTFNDSGDGDAGFVFVKLDSNGADLAATAPSWSCVRDEVTGLVWENKAFDAASPHYSYFTFSWRNDSGINDGGDPGVSDGGECLVAGTCDTQQYVDEMNAAALCGFTDWRLPTVDELFSISDFNLNTLINTPGVDSRYFHPNPNGDAAYWSATPAAGSSASAWMVQQSRFGTRTTDYNKGAAAHVRLVRGGVQ